MINDLPFGILLSELLALGREREVQRVVGRDSFSIMVEVRIIPNISFMYERPFYKSSSHRAK